MGELVDLAAERRRRRPLLAAAAFPAPDSWFDANSSVSEQGLERLNEAIGAVDEDRNLEPLDGSQ